jgi:hypothetical protein
VGSPKLRVTAWRDNKFQQPSIALGAEVEIGTIFPPIPEDCKMNVFKFNFEDDDEGFELVEEDAPTIDLVEDDEEETVQTNSEDDVIWETEEED